VAVLGAAVAFFVNRRFSTHTLTGTYIVFEEDQKSSGSCSPISKGYDDVGPGTDVVVSSPNGSELAFGELEGGFAVTLLESLREQPPEEFGGERAKRELENNIASLGSRANNGCKFDFRVSGIPKGERYYVVMIGRTRGEQRVEESDMKKPLRLSLGDMADLP